MVTKGNPLVAVIAGLIFFVIGAYLSYAEFAATTWDLANGTIQYSKVASEYYSDGTMYRADIKYSYNYSGKNYIGNCCSISSSSSSDAQRFVGSHETGQTTDVYVNPTDPYQSRLKDDVNPFEILYIAFMGIGGLVALFGAYLTFKSMRQKEKIG